MAVTVELPAAATVSAAETAAALAAAVRTLWDDPARTAEVSRNCLGAGFNTVAAYTEKLMPIYLGKSC